MNYPVWDVSYLGAGLVVAIIAIVHMLISHLAIGGGAFLFVAEIWSDRQPEGRRIRDWLHKYATFFLVFTTVAGALTGVGIWFSIQLASPEGTSLLIHQFVFAWATEWVMFLAELTILYLYYYGWDRNSRSLQRFLAGAYFVIAWLSLVVINGILTFMLTPGGWTVENRDIVAAFFNPGYWPSLGIRTLLTLIIGGLSAILVASRIQDEPFKSRIVRFSAKWVIPAGIGLPVFVLWYWSTLPQTARSLAEAGVAGLAGGRLEAMARFGWLAGIAIAAVLLGTLALAVRPRAASTTGAVALLLIVLCGIMGGEFFREMARKPYVVYGTLYANSVWKQDAQDPQRNRLCYLDRTRWDPPVEPLSLGHGRWVFRLQCVSCHTRDGYRAIKPRTAAWTPSFGFRWLLTMDSQGVMPPFQGDAGDRAALTAYLLSLHGRKVSAAEILADAQKAAREAKPAGMTQSAAR